MMFPPRIPPVHFEYDANVQPRADEEWVFIFQEFNQLNCPYWLRASLRSSPEFPGVFRHHTVTQFISKYLLNALSCFHHRSSVKDAPDRFVTRRQPLRPITTKTMDFPLHPRRWCQSMNRFTREHTHTSTYSIGCLTHTNIWGVFFYTLFERSNKSKIDQSSPGCLWSIITVCTHITTARVSLVCSWTLSSDAKKKRTSLQSADTTEEFERVCVRLWKAINSTNHCKYSLSKIYRFLMFVPRSTFPWAFALAWLLCNQQAYFTWFYFSFAPIHCCWLQFLLLRGKKMYWNQPERRCCSVFGVSFSAWHTQFEPAKQALQ